MTRLNFLLLVACIGILVGIAFAQGDAANGGAIRGTITDTTPAQNPIEGVEIKIVAQDGTEFTTTTDVNGNYKHAGLPAGRYLIIVKPTINYTLKLARLGNLASGGNGGRG